MKSFFWEKLPDNRIGGTFWAEHKPAYELLNMQEVEELFQVAPRANPAAKKKAASPAAAKIAVLELKRATAIGIRISRLKLPWGGMREGILRLDPGLLGSAEAVRGLLACVPSEDEARMLQSYVASGGRRDMLSDAELFCLELMMIPRVTARLTTFCARFEAFDRLAEARRLLLHHAAAHRQLRSSPALAAALSGALALGNFVNFGTRLGGAAGFRLKNLPKLADTRSAGGTISLLLYVARQLSRQKPPPALLADELPDVMGPAVKTSLADLADMLDAIDADMADVRAELKLAEPSAELELKLEREADSGDESGAGDGAAVEVVRVRLVPDNYADVMAGTLAAVAAELRAVKALQAQAQAGFTALLAYFGENAAALSSEADFWRELQSFVSQFTAAQRTYLQQQQELQKREERRLRSVQSEKQPASPREEDAPGPGLSRAISEIPYQDHVKGTPSSRVHASHVADGGAAKPEGAAGQQQHAAPTANGLSSKVPAPRAPPAAAKPPQNPAQSQAAPIVAQSDANPGQSEL